MALHEFNHLCECSSQNLNKNIDPDMFRRPILQSQNNENSGNVQHEVEPQTSATTELMNAGQRQTVEAEFAEQAQSMPLSVETTSKNSLKEVLLSVFQSLSKRSAELCTDEYLADAWTNRFPCLLPDGLGGPIGIFVPITSKEWCRYVVQISSLNFHRHIIFISYSNIILRRQKITGLAANKPANRHVIQAVEKLVSISQNSITAANAVPDSDLRVLSKQISLFVDTLPGSAKDMHDFRKDLISMMIRHGPPTYFLTLSVADSIWPETYIEITRGRMSLEQVKKLSVQERTNLLAENPVRATQAWKRRLSACIKFLLESKSLPIGKIKHYALKAEWQGRLSEHAHMLLWADNKTSTVTFHILNDGTVAALPEENSAIIEYAESVSSAFLPVSDCSYLDLNNSDTIKTSLPEIIRRDPVLLEPQITIQNRKNLSDLIRMWQTHSCSAYCTKNKTQACKSHFPFHKCNQTKISSYIDAKNDFHFRINLRRNSEYINNFSLPILKFWRANMDIQTLCGTSFAALVYVAYYTSKTDKMACIKDVLKKLRRVNPESNHSQLLRKILLCMETYRPIGAPEAASNLLQYPHRSTSWTVKRLDTRIYLINYVNDGIPNISNPTSSTPSVSLNDILSQVVAQDNRFQLRPSHSIRKKANHTGRLDPILDAYFSRPNELESLSMCQFVENYETKRRKKLHPRSAELLNRNGNVVTKLHLSNTVVLDLKYYVSPPDRKNANWCAGALALHVPHRSIQQLLQNKSAVEMYEIYASTVDSNELPKYPLLLDFEKKLHQLQNFSVMKRDTCSNMNRKDSLDKTTKFSSNESQFSQMEENDLEVHFNETEHCDSDTQDLQELEDLFTELADTESESESHNALHSSSVQNEVEWNGSVNRILAACNDPSQIVDESYKSKISLSSDDDDNFDINRPSHISEHLSFMKVVLSGQSPTKGTPVITEVDQALKAAGNNRQEASQNFLKYVLSQCKTSAQEQFLLTTTSFICYYYGLSNVHDAMKFPNDILENALHHPVMVAMGVPGAGKSWLISRLRTWTSIILCRNAFPVFSAEHSIINNPTSNPISLQISSILSEQTDGIFGRVAILCMSGAAAGSVKGVTIHSGLHFSTQMSHRVKEGIEPLPELSEKLKLSLLQEWKGVKLLILDECFTISAHWISIINERLKQIFDSSQTFAGLPVLLVGDPRQIVPVSGRPLYLVSKYIPQPHDTTAEICRKQKYTLSELSLREEEAFQLYAKALIHIPLYESIRMKDKDFAQVTIAASKYLLNPHHINEINSRVLSTEALYSDLWINAIWMFPTWSEVNAHLSRVTRIMQKTKGIRRLWPQVRIPPNTPTNIARKALKAFFTSKYDVSSDWKYPAPFLDVFEGQIICLKRNWNPAWGLYNNAKAFVLGIHFYDDNKCPRNAEEAINAALHQKLPRYEILAKPFLPFSGISALPYQSGVLCVPWGSTKKGMEMFRFQ